eukprot:m.253924 g.253924  ORF g.253924 m.253924 type:complete len:99 (+) comp40376_c1_seq12:48-344(+)
MFKRKMKCLRHPSADSIDISAENEFRALIVWLEDQKIRHYKIEERQALRDVKSDAWTPAFNKYLDDMGSRMTVRTRPASLTGSLALPSVWNTLTMLSS